MSEYSYWRRCIADAGPGVQARFKESLGLFFEAVNVQAADRDSDIIPDLESYINVRRDTSGCKPVFDLIEYALRIDLPDHVVNHPVIKALNQGTNDLVTWSNVCEPSIPFLFRRKTDCRSDLFRISSHTTSSSHAGTRTT